MIQAAADKAGASPLAYAIFTEKGNIQAWCADHEQAERLALRLAVPMEPLHLEPPQADANPDAYSVVSDEGELHVWCADPVQLQTLKEQFKDKLQPLYIRGGWVPASKGMPAYDLPVLCKLQHATTGSIQEHELVRVQEEDCSWRTADDHAELSHDWNVIEWLDQP